MNIPTARRATLMGDPRTRRILNQAMFGNDAAALSLALEALAEMIEEKSEREGTELYRNE